MKVWIASDHGGFALKEQLKSALTDTEWHDCGCDSEESVDYPDFADKLIKEMESEARGVLICGTGQGMSIRANKHSHIRAALCWNKEIALLAREHNNANVLCLPGRHLSPIEAISIVETFLNTEFSGGRHERRVQKLSNPI